LQTALTKLVWEGESEKSWFDHGPANLPFPPLILMKHAAIVKSLVAITLILLWCWLAWFIVETYFHSRIESRVSEEKSITHARAQDLADSIKRNLNYIDGVPKFFTHAVRVNRSLALFGANATPSILPYETRKKRWTEEPLLKDLSQTLAIASASFNVDLIYVVNAAGDIVAGSNWDTPDSVVGINVADRHYLQSGEDGQPMEQYAVGRTTHIPGLYYSLPVISNGTIMGAVVAKVNVPDLSFLVRQTKSFVADKNGIIILANDPNMEMLSVPGSSIGKMPAAKRQAIYQRSGFPELQVKPWGDKDFPALLRIQGNNFPLLMVSQELSEYGFTIYAEGGLPTYHKLMEERSIFFLLLSGLGCMLILSTFGGLQYIRSNNQSREVLRQSEKKWRLLFENMTTGFALHEVICNDRGQVVDYRFLEVNSAYEQLTGLKGSRIIGHTVLEMLPGTERYWIDNFGKVALTGEPITFENFSRELGRWYHVRAFSPGAGQFAVIVTDTTQNKEAEEAMQLASMVYKNSSEAIMITDAENRIIAVNPAFETMTGYTLDEVRGRNPRIFKSGRHDQDFYRAMWHALNAEGHWNGEVWDKHKDGGLHVKLLTINTIKGDDGKVFRYVALFNDITERKKVEELIWEQANFDTLTRLPNRNMFHDRLGLEAKKCHRSGQPMALMLIDLDRFKEVNDALGHDKGDMLLVEAAQRISACVRESDTVSRLGGDEFTIILSELDDMGSIERIAHDIINKLADPFPLGAETAYVSASIGISLYPNDTNNLDALLKNADQAMYAAKNAGRNRFGYFTHDMQEAAQKRLRLFSDMRAALVSDQFRVYYQPIVEMASGRIFKAEALIRWQHPERGMISPMEFIPLAEETGLIVSIGDWVFKTAAQQAQQWCGKFDESFQVSVNKSPVQIRHEGGDHILWPDYLKQHGIPGHSIAVEITEGMLLNAESAVNRKLLGFRDAGIQVSIDDFGTGYSSLSYLKEFDIDYLKIDQSFVLNLEPETNSLALCEAIIVMAHKLGLKVIAEGVETASQRDLLKAAGCDFAQGYFYSRPVPPEEFENLLNTGNR
jgi:diguanylate cyclase (GGDEF)-like protein/PAS domain S-box-containing protein